MSSKSFENFLKALKNLERSLATPPKEHRDLSGIIKDFEMAYELSWKVLKKNLLEQGHQTQGAKDVYTQAYRLNLIDRSDEWVRMIEDRNQTSHVYDEAAAQVIIARIRDPYLALFQDLAKRVK